MFGGAVSCQTGCDLLWTGTQSVCVTGPRDPIWSFKEEPFRLPCCFTALRVSNTKQRISVWRCKKNILYLIILNVSTFSSVNILWFCARVAGYYSIRANQSSSMSIVVCLWLCKQEVGELQRKHRETSLLTHLEGLLREKSSLWGKFFFLKEKKQEGSFIASVMSGSFQNSFFQLQKQAGHPRQWRSLEFLSPQWVKLP